MSEDSNKVQIHRGLKGVYFDRSPTSFIDGRVASVRSADGAIYGLIGEVHPEVLENFHLEYPVCLAEICVSEIDFGPGE